MKREAKTKRKQVRITPKTFEDAERIREETGLTDSDLYEAGVKVHQSISRTAELDSSLLHNMYKFAKKKGQDDLVSEEYQGNAGFETLSMRAKMYFSISDQEWDALSEKEKDDYIRRLPGQKRRSGGEEMSDRDNVFVNKHMDSTVARDFFIGEMVARTARLQKKNARYTKDREG